jgi:serine/threonine protein kinase
MHDSSLHVYVSCSYNHYSIQQYMHRGSLRQVLNSTESWSEFTPVMKHQLLCDISDGMQFLHDQEVFHRDLKSHNVLITDDHRAVLTDFGLSKTATTISGMTNTKSSFAGGTLAWTAPEVLNARRGVSCFTAKSDVYSFGVVQWEVLCGVMPTTDSNSINNGGSKAIGNLPWHGMTFLEIITAVVSRGERPEVPAEYVNDSNVTAAAAHVAIMTQCFKGDATERPSFVEVGQQLAAAAAVAVSR